MRVRSSVINAIVSIVAQVATILITFISRRVFLMVLGENILGVNSLFSQIISMMSLVELGIGSAIVYSLYQPLAVNNKEQIVAIMRLYRKIYSLIGVIVLVVGTILTPFITFFISGDISEISSIYLIFMLFVVNSSFSYFNAYKQNLIVADQKKYITIIVHNGLFIILNVIQIALLLKTKNYEIFLVLQILVTLLENLILSYITKKEYPYLSEYKEAKVDKNILNNIKKNVKALLLHRIGGIFVSSTDTIIISKFIGIVVVGKYTNYNYVTNAFNTLTTNLFSSFTSSVGNFNVEATDKEKYTLFRKLFYLNYVVFGFISVCILCLINDFIRIFFGTSMVLESVIVLLIVGKFYAAGMRSAVLTYKDSLGIYHQDRYRPILEGAVNLVCSLALVRSMGLAGVILATIVSNLCINMWIEPMVVYEEAFEKKWTDYLIHYSRYLVYTCVISVFMWKIAEQMVVYTFLQLFLKAILIAILSVVLIIFSSFLMDRKEIAYYFSLVKRIIAKKL